MDKHALGKRIGVVARLGGCNDTNYYTNLSVQFSSMLFFFHLPNCMIQGIQISVYALSNNFQYIILPTSVLPDVVLLLKSI